jgi:hypothetical protein
MVKLLEFVVAPAEFPHGFTVFASGLGQCQKRAGNYGKRACHVLPLQP